MERKKLITTILVFTIILSIFATCVFATEEVVNETEIEDKTVETTPPAENESREGSEGVVEQIPSENVVAQMPSQDDYILQEIEGGIRYYNTMPSTISKDYFRVAKENNKSLRIFEGSYSGEWNFFKITNTDVDFNPALDLNYKPLSDEYNGKISFNKFLNTGAFPGEATYQYRAAWDNIPGSLKVFKYNESAKTYTYVANASHDGSYYSYNISETNSIYAIVVHGNSAIESLNIGATISEADLLAGFGGEPAVEEIVAETVDSQKFEEAKGANKGVVVTTTDKKITWEFASGSITNPNITLVTNGKIQNEKFEFVNNNYISDDEGIYIDFLHNGALPGKAKVTVKVGTEKFGTGNKRLYLYYYNPVENTYKYNGDVKYSNGVAEFSLNHCSTYVMIDHRIDVAGTGNSAGGVAPAAAQYVGGVLDNEPKTGEVSLVGIFMLSAVSLAVFVFTKQYK